MNNYFLKFLVGVLTVVLSFFYQQLDVSAEENESFLQRGNPLQDLFTPQPQYSTGQTLANPQPQSPAAGETNPLKGLFTPDTQFPTSQTIANPHPQPQEGEPNHFKGLFTPQPQFPTPQAIPNPDAVPRFFVPERLPQAKTDNSEQKVDGAFGTNEPPAESKGENEGEEKPNLEDKISSDAEQERADKTHTKYDPVREALLHIQLGQYQDSMSLLNKILALNPRDVRAHYLKAMTHVLMRDYITADQEYRLVMSLSPNSQLSRMAEQGLRKLGRY